MAKLFVPGTPLEEQAYAGKYQAVVDLLRTLDASGRQALGGVAARLVKISQAARYAYDDGTFAGWGRSPSDEQLRAVGAAAVVCGSAKVAAEGYFDVEDVIALAREFAPPSLEEMPAEMMRVASWRANIHDVQKLIEAGVVSRPQTDEYVLGLMLLFSHARMESRDVDAHFAADPGLKDALLRIFEVEGIGDVSLAAVDKYCHEDRTWSKRLVEFAQRGIYSRRLLIDRTLGSLERGWIQFRSGWFSQFHVRLAPTLEEMKPHALRYVSLLASRIPPTVTFALGVVKELEKADLLDPLPTLNALRPVFSSPVKSQVEAALKLGDRIVKREPACSGEAAKIILPALAHESAEVQKQVLQRIEVWKLDAAGREALAPYAGGIAATHRDTLARLMGATTVASGPAAPVQASAPAAAPADSLDESRRVAPIADLDELVERVAYVFENDTDTDEFERALSGLVRFAPLSDDARARFAPLARRIGKVRKPVSQQLARLLEFLLSGTRSAADSTVDHSGHKAKAQLHLIERVNDLMDFVAHAGGATPLGTPTHRRGFIDAPEFVRRLASHQASGVKSSQGDFLVGIMRLAPRSAAAARPELAKLDAGPLSQALRHALGEDVPGPTGDLSGAARRMRALCAGIRPPPREWQLTSTKFGNGKTYTRVDVAPPGEDTPVDPVTAMSLAVEKPEKSYWFAHNSVGGIDEGSILYFASLLPADLEGLFADGVSLLSRNLDWFEAQWENAAYLRQLLHGDVPVDSLAAVLLALGLAGKEPGQAAIATDALVQSHAEGRLDVAALAGSVRGFLRGDLAACARYAKSLRAALRIEAGAASAVFAVLCEAIAARPADPPKDTASLLELMLEIVLGHRIGLPAATREALESLQVGGKGKSLRRQLLAQPAN